MKFKILFLVAVILAACEHKAPTPPENGENINLPQWPMFGKNLRHTRNAADPVEYYPGPQEGNVIWTLDFGLSERCYASPSIGNDGTIYLATTVLGSSTNSGFVYAITPEGTIKWRFKTVAGNSGGGAVGVDGTYFIGSNDEQFYAISREGNLRWKMAISNFAPSQ